MRRETKMCSCGEPTIRPSGECAMCETDWIMFQPAPVARPIPLKKIKTAELTGIQLDYWTARAEGRGIFKSLGMIWILYGGGIAYITNHGQEQYRPSTDWAHGGPLIEKYHLNVSECDPPAWRAWSNDLDAEYGDTPLRAICRAVVRAAFGDEVEEVTG